MIIKLYLKLNNLSLGISLKIDEQKIKKPIIPKSSNNSKNKLSTVLKDPKFVAIKTLE